ncbi:hypothetical protein Tco_0138768 [Tanacetum coccineum]
MCIMTSRPRTRVFCPGPVWGCDRLVSSAKVMAAPVISILSDTSKESVGSHALQVILFGAIPAIIHVISEVPIILANPIVTPEVGTILVISPSGVLDLLDYSPSSDSDPSDDSLPPAPDLPLVSPFLCSDDSEANGFVDVQRLLSDPVRLSFSVDLIAPTSMGRCTFRSFLIRDTPPDTTDADSSTPQRFVHRSLARTPRHSLSSERSLDLSSPSSWPSRKRCRSPTTSVPSPTHVSRSIAPTPADLLPLRKRFRDSYLPEDNEEEHIEVDTADAEAVADDDEEFEAGTSTADTREIVVDPFAIGDSFESSRGGILDLEDTIYDIVYYMSGVRIHRITEIETT